MLPILGWLLLSYFRGALWEGVRQGKLEVHHRHFKLRQQDVFKAWNQIINKKFGASKGARLKFDWEGTFPADSLKTRELRISLETDRYNKQLALTRLPNAPRNLWNMEVLRWHSQNSPEGPLTFVHDLRDVEPIPAYLFSKLHWWRSRSSKLHRIHSGRI